MRNFVYYNMSLLTQHIMDILSDKDTTIVNAKTWVFVVYLVVCVLIYLLLLKPFADHQKSEYVQTKDMLCIVPFELARQNNEIHRYVQETLMIPK